MHDVAYRTGTILVATVFAHGSNTLNHTLPPSASPTLQRAWRYLRLALHLATGIAAVLVVVPLAGRRVARIFRHRWCHALLRILGVKLDIRGEELGHGVLLVANHVSWIDILVVNALTPSAFVSKAEVRGWPLIGWLAVRNETVFLRRGSRGHAKIVNSEIAALLASGCNVALFPEGTTTDGSHVLHFHAALLQPAVESGARVQAVAISYRTADGRFTRSPAYDGEVTLAESLATIIATRNIVARVQVAPSLSSIGSTRRELARSTRAAIIEAIGCEDRSRGQANGKTPTSRPQSLDTVN